MRNLSPYQSQTAGIKLRDPPQPNALQNYLTYLFHVILLQSSGHGKGTPRQPHGVVDKGIALQRPLGQLLLDLGTELTKRTDCKSSVETGQLGQTPEKGNSDLKPSSWKSSENVGAKPSQPASLGCVCKTCSIRWNSAKVARNMGLGESHHWDQQDQINHQSISDPTLHITLFNQPDFEVIDSGWESRSKTHIGLVIATFPPNRPNLQGFPPPPKSPAPTPGVRWGVGNVTGTMLVSVRMFILAREVHAPI